MKIIDLLDEDFINYKKASMLIAFPYCSFKCNEDCGKSVCQNKDLIFSKKIEIRPEKIVQRYLENPITSAVVFQGLEPFDSFGDMYELIAHFRSNTDDDIVIYTGYKEEEISSEVLLLSRFENIIVKFGRFVPDQDPHYDEILGVNIASDNQYAKRLGCVN